MTHHGPLNWFEHHQSQLSFGDRVSDAVTGFIGSWKFIILQTCLMTVWVVYNTAVVSLWLTTGAFDPFPFVFLNLFMSAEAAYSTPFIMMSQNRAAERDRAKAEADHQSIGLLVAEMAILKQVNQNQLEMLEILTGKGQDDGVELQR